MSVVISEELRDALIVNVQLQAENLVQAAREEGLEHHQSVADFVKATGEMVDALRAASPAQAPVVPSVQRYEMVTSYNRFAQEEQVKPVPDDKGMWVKYSDLTHGWRADWIPVSERLPENQRDVLVFDRDKRIVVGFCSSWDQSWHEGTHYLEWVTHWQPLPEPPKSESTPDLSHESHAPWIVVDTFPAPLLYWCPVHRWVGRVEKAALFFSYSDALDIAEKHQAHVVPLESVQGVPS
jgi:hypothetical protein